MDPHQKNKAGQILTRQLELPLARSKEPDRNFKMGGRSFYFFDFDDNVAFLGTPIFLFHKETGDELTVTSREFAEIHAHLGKVGIYRNFQLDYDDSKGSFRAFRDLIAHRSGSPFVQHVQDALIHAEEIWKGPSWSCFYHAVYNHRPVSLITARGHAPESLQKGIQQWVEAGHLPHEPNYLSLWPVNHPEIRGNLERDVLGRHPEFLQENLKIDVSRLKKAAIRRSVEQALEVYGENPHHRFGMSDDDPKNIEMILEAMVELKRDYPRMSFFVISTTRGTLVKREVFTHYTQDSPLTLGSQLSLFQSDSI